MNGTPPHTTGAAVDISLLDNDGKEINLSDPFLKYYDEPHLISTKITKEAQEKRLLLHKLMTEENFAPNKNEYWHFSYGDNDWAEYYKKKPIYEKSYELPKSYYYPKYKIILIKIYIKLWKITNHLLKIDRSY